MSPEEDEQRQREYEDGVLSMMAMDWLAKSIPLSSGRIPNTTGNLRLVTFPNRFLYEITFEHQTDKKRHFLSPECIKELEEVGRKYGLKMCSISEESNV